MLENEQSSTLPSLYLRHSSFSSPSVALPTSQLILQPFRFSYVTSSSLTSLASRLWCIHLCNNKVRARSRSFPSLHLRHSSFSSPSVALPTSQLILQPFFLFSYVTSSSLTSLASRPWSMHLCNNKVRAHSPSFRHFTYVTAHSLTLISLLLRHKFFTYVPS